MNNLKTINKFALLCIGAVGVGPAFGDDAPSPCAGSIEYQAVKLAAKTYLFAKLTVPNPGYKVSFKDSPANKAIPFPHFDLLCAAAPHGALINQVVVPRIAVTLVNGEREVPSTVAVLDAGGIHQVPLWMEIPIEGASK